MSLEPSASSLDPNTTTAAWLVRLESGLVQGTQLVQRVRGGRAAWDQVGGRAGGEATGVVGGRRGRWRDQVPIGMGRLMCGVLFGIVPTPLRRSPACRWAAGGGARVARGLPAGVQGGRRGGTRAVQGGWACWALVRWLCGTAYCRKESILPLLKAGCSCCLPQTAATPTAKALPQGHPVGCGYRRPHCKRQARGTLLTVPHAASRQTLLAQTAVLHAGTSMSRSVRLIAPTDCALPPVSSCAYRCC